MDPTDLSNWPACAVSLFLSSIIMTDMLIKKQQKCIPKGFGPPANCGSLSNLDCICDNPDFALSIADCELETCLLSERAGKCRTLKRRRSLLQQANIKKPQVHDVVIGTNTAVTEITKLSIALCAPKGGEGPAVTSAIASYFATNTAGLPSTPVIVAPTPAPSLGNTSDLNIYPSCDVSNPSITPRHNDLLTVTTATMRLRSKSRNHIL